MILTVSSPALYLKTSYRILISCIFSCTQTVRKLSVCAKVGDAPGLWHFSGERPGSEPIYSSSLGKVCHRNKTAPAAPVGFLVSFCNTVLQKSDNKCYRCSCCLCFVSECRPRCQSVEMVCEAFSAPAGCAHVPRYVGTRLGFMPEMPRAYRQTHSHCPSVWRRHQQTKGPSWPLISWLLVA